MIAACVVVALVAGWLLLGTVVVLATAPAWSRALTSAEPP